MHSSAYNAFKDHVGATSNGSTNELSSCLDSDMWKQALFNVLISPKFAELCVLLCGNFHGIIISSLLPERKLKSLFQRPVNHLPESKDGYSLLLFWYWEECLKQRYEQLVFAPEEASRDVLAVLKDKALKTMYTLLSSKSKSHVDMNSRLLTALLTGVNRAFPFVSSNEADDILEVQTPMLFQLVHSKIFNVGVQALLLLDKISSKNQLVSDRFYRALYSKLLLPAAMSSSKEEMFIGLLLKAMKSDVNLKRVAVFAKRLLQVALQQPPQYACGCLFLLSEVLKAMVSVADAGETAVVSIAKPPPWRDKIESYLIKLSYTSNMPIILQSALVSNLYFISQLLYRKYSGKFLVNLLGKWQESEYSGHSSPRHELMFLNLLPEMLLSSCPWRSTMQHKSFHQDSEMLSICHKDLEIGFHQDYSFIRICFHQDSDISSIYNVYMRLVGKSLFKGEDML